MPDGRLTWVEISRSALVHNARLFRRLAGPRRLLLGVVKANAYGHGLIEAAGILTRSGIDWLGVHSIDEAAALRAAGLDAPILILGYVPLAAVEEAAALDIRLTVYNDETVWAAAAAARKLGRPVRLHLKVETGTNRQGVPPARVPAMARRIARRPGLVLEGLTSHFANIEDTTSREYPRRQLRVFLDVCQRLRAAGTPVPMRHMTCTAAALLFPETRFELLRIGIGLYGLWPSKETLVSWAAGRRGPLDLRPVLSWKARIAQVKDVPKGSDIGYGCTFRTTRRTRLAVVPVGYAEGYDRRLSNAGHVLIRGRRAPVRGRVAMDFFMADVTDVPGAALEGEAVLIGRAGRERISANDLAGLAGTIGYEIVARINPRVPRIVVR